MLSSWEASVSSSKVSSDEHESFLPVERCGHDTEVGNVTSEQFSIPPECLSALTLLCISFPLPCIL